MDFRFIGADKREALYNEVWAEPVTTVAKRYGMSDNGLRKHCKKLGIPLPAAGYWARVKSGQQVPRPALPKVTGELRNHVRNYFIQYKADIDKLTDAELAVDEEFGLLTDETKNHIREICSQLQVKNQLRSPHHLITEHKEETIYRKKRDKALKQADFSTNYYWKVKSEYRDNKPIFPIKVSDCNINRTYRILDAMISTLEEMEGETTVSLDAGKDTAYFDILYSHFYFEVKEDARKKPISQDNGESQPCLMLSMSVKGRFNNYEQLKKEYKDKDNEPLETRVGKIIYDMFVIANKQRVLEILRSREQKRIWDEQERRRRLEQIKQKELEEVRQLEQTASDWHKAELVRRFANSLEGKINEVSTEEKREKLLKWLKWARDKADWLDPLTAKEDKLLGRNKHIFELIERTNF
ncbi:MAG: hypothetical protein PHU23_03145 [Dehalococcoidales bacterium]|nr:hypothetical protein [Dehalococcoidales bacterium]